ncbi:hypothetical protein F2P56_013253 [Juglans regia]|uniref:Uncharacterized protein LOC108980346 n=2 Tax=Juglans regia TaxID=51240 RepID=A0A2I4DI00_JUGRE|nr:uncharacterized protein LOC108980346 [Juglans regia]KAF5469159.1 hypothetical protein F2P56_013253 [Juglans regia]
MTELVRKTPSTLREFMDRADDYVNTEDTLQALLEPRKKEVKSEIKNSNSARDRKTDLSHQDGGKENTPKRRTFNLEKCTAIAKEIDHLLAAGSIRETYYPYWLSNVVLVKKANKNKACPNDNFPLPMIDIIIDTMAGHRKLSLMDAYSVYNQIRMNLSDEEKTTFIIDRDLYCYQVMPFEVKNAGTIYQRLVHRMFKQQIKRTMEVCVNDLLVKIKKPAEHLADLRESFVVFRKYKMKLNSTKCAFRVDSGNILGFIVSERGIEANTKNIGAILNMKPSQNINEAQRLAGRVAALNRTTSYTYTWQYPPRRLCGPSQGRGSNTGNNVLHEPRIKRYRDQIPMNGNVDVHVSDSRQEITAIFLGSPMKVLTEHPFGRILQKLYSSGRLVVWSVELNEFDIDYMPRSVVKRQALADFIIEFTRFPMEAEVAPCRQPWLVFVDGSAC